MSRVNYRLQSALHDWLHGGFRYDNTERNNYNIPANGFVTALPVAFGNRLLVPIILDGTLTQPHSDTRQEAFRDPDNARKLIHLWEGHMEEYSTTEPFVRNAIIKSSYDKTLRKVTHKGVTYWFGKGVILDSTFKPFITIYRDIPIHNPENRESTHVVICIDKDLYNSDDPIAKFILSKFIPYYSEAGYRVLIYDLPRFYREPLTSPPSSNLSALANVWLSINIPMFDMGPTEQEEDDNS